MTGKQTEAIKRTTYQNAIARFKDIATAHGLEATDRSSDGVLRIEYRKDGVYMGGASYIGCAEHPEWLAERDMKSAELQVSRLSAK